MGKEGEGSYKVEMKYDGMKGGREKRRKEEVLVRGNGDREDERKGRKEEREEGRMHSRTGKKPGSKQERC